MARGAIGCAIAAAAFGAQQAYYRPLTIGVAGYARLHVFQEVFAGAQYPQSEAPTRISHQGVTRTFELAHYVNADGTNLSFWADPALIQPVRAVLGQG